MRIPFRLIEVKSINGRNGTCIGAEMKDNGLKMRKDISDDPDDDFEMAKIAVSSKAQGKNMGYLLGQSLINTEGNGSFKNMISGRYKLKFGGEEYLLSEGDTYSIPADVEHFIEIIEAGEVVDVFSPIRQDYL